MDNLIATVISSALALYTSVVTAEAALLLLALRVQDDRHLLYKYKQILHDKIGFEVSIMTIKKFNFKGKLGKPNFVPLAKNKWTVRNFEAYDQFMETLCRLSNHRK